jgi:MFS family permease
MKTNRIAVATIFFVNGFLYANWTSRLPEMERFFGISHTELGVLLFLCAAGAIIAMPFTGYLNVRFGNEKLTKVTALAFSALLPTVVFTHNFWLAGLSFFLIGMNNGAMDVSMNGQAVFVERLYKKPIMSSFHAIFSVGMALGAGIGAFFSKMDYALLTQFSSMALIGFVANLWATANLIPDNFTEKTVENLPKKKSAAGFQLPTATILPLGIIAFCAMTGEGSMADWSAIFMHKIVGASASFSAIAFGVFATAMVIGRFAGDYLTQKWGIHKLLIINSLCAIFGLSLALIFANTTATLIGFFFVGLGLATVVPIIYSAAGNTKGVEPSVGIAMATTIGYAGFFIGPPVIGFLADQFDLRIALFFTLALFVWMLWLVVVLRRTHL